MAAYLIYSRTDITDEAVSKEYGRLVIPQIHEFGGEVLVARGAVTPLEGDWDPLAVTILKFDDRDALMRWYDSEEYEPLKQMRLESNLGDMIIVEGA
jgi:uncharacterized protein (DUF1330 family)